MHPARQAPRQSNSRSDSVGQTDMNSDRQKVRQTESQINSLSVRHKVRQTEIRTNRKLYSIQIFGAFGAFKWNYDNGLTPDLETAKIFDV